MSTAALEKPQAIGDETLETATVISLATGSYVNPLALAGDDSRDVYKFTADVTGVSDIRLDTPSRGNADFTVYDAQYNLIASSHGLDSTNDRVSFGIVANQAYYVVVDRVGTETTSTSLHINTHTAVTTETTDFGDGSIGTITPLALNVPISGRINSNADIDAFTFIVPKGEQYVLRVDGSENGGGTLNGVGLSVQGVQTVDGNADQGDAEYVITGDGTTTVAQVSRLAATGSIAGTYNISLTRVDTQVVVDRGDIPLTADVTTGLGPVALNLHDNIRSNLTAGDIDAFTFTVRDGEQYIVKATGTGSSPLTDPDLVLRTSGRAYLNQAIGTGNSEQLTISAAGTYTVDVQSFSGRTGGYALSLEAVGSAARISPTVADIGATNTTTANLSANAHVFSDLSSGTDVDRFKIVVADGEGFNIRVGASGTTPSADLDLVVRDANGVYLSQSVSSSSSENIFLAGTGTYYIDVQSFARTAGDYSIDVQRAIDPTAEIPGTSGSAYVLTSNTNVVSTLSSSTDIDRIKLVVAEGHEYHIDLGAHGTPGASNPDLVVRTANGEYYSQDIDTGDSHVTLATAGTYWLDVRSFSGSTGGYELSVDAQQDAPGDSTSTFVLTSGVVNSDHTLSSSNDVDRFKLVVAAGEQFDIQVSGSGDNVLSNPDIVLRAADGTYINQSVANSGSTDHLVVSSAGTYWVDVQSFTRAQGDYDIQIVAQQVSASASESYTALPPTDIPSITAHAA